MTTTDETVKAPEKPAKAGSTAGFIFTAGIAAILVWLSGVALNRGFGVHLPFVAGLILVLSGLQVIKLAANEVAHSWYSQAIAATPRLTATAAAGAFIAQTEIEAALDAEGFLAMDKKIRDMSEKVDGGYL